MKIAFLNIIVLLASAFFSNAQDCSPDNLPFKSGEKLSYRVYYNLKRIWVPAGVVDFQVSDTTVGSKSLMQFKSNGKTFKEYDIFFKVRDKFQSLVNKNTLQPERFIRDVNEGGYTIYYDYVFDQKKDKAYVYGKKNDKEPTTDTIAVPDCSFDVLTAIYYARSLDFSGLAINDTIPLTLVLDKKIYPIYIRYLGKEVYKTKKNKYNCIKFSPLLVEGTIFEDGEHMTVYVTDDKSRIPLFIEAKILVGTIKAYLEDFEGLKYEIEAKIK